MSERAGPVVWFSYTLHGADDAVVEQVEQPLPDAFSLLAPGTRFRAAAVERRYGLALLAAHVEVEVDVDGMVPQFGRIARVSLHDLPVVNIDAPPTVVVDAAATEVGAALALVPHVELLARKALEWAQAHASQAPVEG